MEIEKEDGEETPVPKEEMDLHAALSPWITVLTTWLSVTSY